MFSNFAWTEMLVIALVAILVVGPKDLPGMLRQLGKAIGSVKRMAGDFQRQFNDAVKDAELDDLKDMTSAKGFSPLEDAKKSMEEFTKTVEDSIKPEPESVVENVAAVDTPAAPAKPVAKRKPAKGGSGSRQAAKKTPGRTRASAKTATGKTTRASAKTATGKTTTTRKAATRKPAARAKTNS